MWASDDLQDIAPQHSHGASSVATLLPTQPTGLGPVPLCPAPQTRTGTSVRAHVVRGLAISSMTS